MAGDGYVKIPVELLTQEANARAKALKSSLAAIKLDGGLAKQSEALANSLNKTSKQASLTKDESDKLKASLKSTATYFDKLAEGQEKANLKTSASVSKLRSLKASLAENSIAVEHAREEYDALSKSEGENSAKTQAAANKYRELSGEQSKLQRETATLSSKVGGLSPQMANSADKARLMGEKLDNTGQKMNEVGNKATIGLTVPIVAGMTKAVSAASDFEYQMADVRKEVEAQGYSAKEVDSIMASLSGKTLQWAQQYGVSTDKINEGMFELVSNGYNVKQAMGMMPELLKTMTANSDNTGISIKLTSSMLEQFGLNLGSNNQVVKNGNDIMNQMTEATHKSAMSLDDLQVISSNAGAAMHGMHVSTADFLAIAGRLKSAGIEASSVGTGLSSMMTRLATGTGAAADDLKKYNIAVYDSHHKMRNIMDIMGDMQGAYKGMNDEEKQKFLYDVMGQENMKVGATLMSAELDRYRDLSKEISNSTGTVDKYNGTMRNTNEFTQKQFKASLEALSITFGQKLLPQLTPVIKELTNMIKGFSELDGSTQQTIIKTALAAAAFGPLVKGVAGAVETVASLHKGYAKIIEISGKLRGTVGTTAGTVEKSAEVVEKTGEIIKGTGAAAETGAAGLAGLGSAGGEAATGIGLLGGALPIVLGVTAAVGAGALVWELWGKKAVESANRTSRWGTDVGDSADKSLTKMQGFSTQASAALEGFNGNTKTTTKQVASNFSDMYEQMVTDSNNSIKKMEDDINDLPGFAKKDAQANVLHRKKANAEILADAKKQNELIQAVLKKHNGDVSKLTDDERTIVLNGRTRMNADEVKLLKISGKAKKSVIAALNGDIDTMNNQQRGKAIDDLTSQFRSEEKTYQKQAATIKKAYSDNTISAKQYGAYMKQLKSEHNASTESMVASVFKLAKANGESKDQITQDLLNFGYTYEQAAKIVKTQSQDMSKSTGIVAADTANMSKETAKANEQWNKLIFDPKTGKVKTNAQEEVNKAAQSKKGWNDLHYDLKHANLSSNAKLMIGEAALANGKWDDLTWKEQQAIVAVKGNKKMADIIQQFGIWDQFTLEQKEAILHGDASPIANLLLKGGQWNMLTLKEQQALVKDKATVPLVNILDKYGVWQGLSDSEKNAILNAKGAPALADMVIKYGAWNNLPQKQKDLLINNADARQKLIDSGILLDTYKTNNPASKPLKAHDGGLAGAVEAGNEQIDGIKRNNPPSKPLKGHDAGLGGSVLRGNNQLDGFKRNTPSSKGLKAHDSGLGGAVATANDNISNFKRNNPKIKNLKANDNASGPADAASSAVDRFGWKRDHKVTLTTVIETVEKKIKSWFAKGTNNAPGGLSVLGDGGQPEPYLEPDGSFGISPSVPTPMVLKRGAKVWPSMAAFKREIPHFAKGTNGTLNDVLSESNNASLQRAFAVRPEVASTFNAHEGDTSVVVNQTNNNQDLIGKIDELINVIRGQAPTINIQSLEWKNAEDIRETMENMGWQNLTNRRGSLT